MPDDLVGMGLGQPVAQVGQGSLLDIMGGEAEVMAFGAVEAGAKFIVVVSCTSTKEGVFGTYCGMRAPAIIASAITPTPTKESCAPRKGLAAAVGSVGTFIMATSYSSQ